jgi:hypothetical protein
MSFFFFSKVLTVDLGQKKSALTEVRIKSGQLKGRQ